MAIAKIIGQVTDYIGAEHPCLRDCHVRIVSVLKGRASPTHDPDHALPALTHDDEILEAGGVEAQDRVEVAPWIEAEQRYGFATHDARAIDLACFRHLRESSHRRSGGGTK